MRRRNQGYLENPDEGIPAANWWFHHTAAFIKAIGLDGVPYTLHAAHAEVIVVTNPSFVGDFLLWAMPTDGNVDSSAISIFVDNVYSKTVTFDVVTLPSRQQMARVHLPVTGAHTIRIQEGDRYFGCFITRLKIDGTILPVPARARQWTSYGDSVSMGVFGVPRAFGWAQRMRVGTRFDGTTFLGQSGLALGTAASTAPARAAVVADIMPTLIGRLENVVCLCLSINDWVSSANSTSAATFQTTLGLLVTAIKAAADAAGTPGFKIMLHGMTRIYGGLPGAANDKGSTPANFNTAIQAVAAANPTFTTYVDLFNVMLDSDLADAFDHPNATGHGKIYAAVRAAT